MPNPINLYNMFMYSSGLSSLANSHFLLARNHQGTPYKHYYLFHKVVDFGYGKMDDLKNGVEQYFTKELVSSSPHNLFFPGTIGYKNKKLRSEKVAQARSYGLRLVSFIHPSALCEADHFAGVWIMENVVIQDTAFLDTACIIWPNVTISHHSEIGAYTWISPGATVCGNVTVEEDCFIGAGAIITNDVRIGHDSIIGAGAVITKDVKPNSVYGSGRNQKLAITADKVHLK